jgi:hypothetical protein
MMQAKPENEYWRKIINTKFDTTKAYITFLQNTLKLEIKSKNKLEQKLAIAKATLEDLEDEDNPRTYPIIRETLKQLSE